MRNYTWWSTSMSLALLFLKAYSHVKNSMLKAHKPVSERVPRLLRKILKVRIMNFKRPRTWLRTSNILNKSPKPDEVVVVRYDASTLGEKTRLPRKVKEWPSLWRWWLPRMAMRLSLEDGKASAPFMPSSPPTTMLSSTCTPSRQPFRNGGIPSIVSSACIRTRFFTMPHPHVFNMHPTRE